MRALHIDILINRLWAKRDWGKRQEKWHKKAAELKRSPLNLLIATSYLRTHNRKITYRERNEAVRIVYRERKKNKRMRLHAYRSWFKIFPS